MLPSAPLPSIFCQVQLRRPRTMKLCYHLTFPHLLSAGGSAEPAAHSCIYNLTSPSLIKEFWACCSPWLDFCGMRWWQVILAGMPHSIWALLIRASMESVVGMGKKGAERMESKLYARGLTIGLSHSVHAQQVQRGPQFQFPWLGRHCLPHYKCTAHFRSNAIQSVPLPMKYHLFPGL